MSFGDSFEERVEEQAEHRYHWADVIVNTTYMNDVMRAVCVIPGLFTFLEWYKTEHMKKTLYRHAEYATEHTEARPKINTKRKDFMCHILASKGPPATNKEVASHFNVIMMAGAVTIATFLAGVTYYLSHNKSALELMGCEYLTAVVEEGLRMYPPAGARHLSRIVSPGDCEIDGEWIPGGTRVLVHQCLAYLEMRMVLAKLFWHYDLVWFNSDEIDWDRDSKGYTLWEKPALRATLRRVE
ncbi:hypothetical protein G7Y89_g11988 [Cudoniella acicularis]|uniref:Uncharacterized protein n=1 Tax=Cudoniella acicularis TaxID=354080 RepID=A0A8H4VXS9_9HELO|nr:hypothetical protein G7Y89_g11988 [Cudoniella acicularis]